MIRQTTANAGKPTLLVGIGNTHTWIATWTDNQVRAPLSISTDDPKAFDDAVGAHLADASATRPAVVVVASVVPKTLQQICAYVSSQFEMDALVIGRNLPLPMDVVVDDPSAIGVDRVCSAMAAYDRLQSDCIVVDFGTAVTVDLVDGDGALQGGAILPGVSLQLAALGEHTAQLPRVVPGIPKSPIGKNTTEAIQNGVCRGVVGAVRALIEAYATSLNRWPQVVATGGDLSMLLPYCDFVDTPVDNLLLHGVGITLSKHLAEQGA